MDISLIRVSPLREYSQMLLDEFYLSPPHLQYVVYSLLSFVLIDHPTLLQICQQVPLPDPPLCLSVLVHVYSDQKFYLKCQAFMFTSYIVLILILLLDTKVTDLLNYHHPEFPLNCINHYTSPYFIVMKKWNCSNEKS